MYRSGPWIVLGDFNCIFSTEDRQGGNTPTLVEMEDFLSSTSNLGLEDAFSTGSQFTWTNGNIWSKIDRVLINLDWHMQNLNCLVEFLQFNTLFDHNLLVVSFPPRVRNTKNPFKFFNMWMIHPRFHTILRNV